MKTKNLFVLMSVLVVFVFFSSCSDDDDVDSTKPVINLIAPANNSVLKIGSDVHFDVKFEDNVMLASYKVDIHPNFDGHGHSKATSETTDFTFNKSWSLEGKKNADIHHHEIIIPENATPGKYHMMVYCWDTAGNESKIFIDIELSHDGEVHEH